MDHARFKICVACDTTDSWCDERLNFMMTELLWLRPWTGRRSMQVGSCFVFDDSSDAAHRWGTQHTGAVSRVRLMARHPDLTGCINTSVLRQRSSEPPPPPPPARRCKRTRSSDGLCMLWRLAMSMAGLAGSGAAKRQRQLQAWHRHVRAAVAMELSTALHHSAQRPSRVVEGPRVGEVHEQHDGPRAQKRPLPGGASA